MNTQDKEKLDEIFRLRKEKEKKSRFKNSNIKPNHIQIYFGEKKENSYKKYCILLYIYFSLAIILFICYNFCVINKLYTL